jgi:hypothetical protein
MCLLNGQEQLVTTVVLLCVVFSALAGGVLLAYSLCLGMFRLFRIHSMQVAQQRAVRQQASQAAVAQA